MMGTTTPAGTEPTLTASVRKFDYVDALRGIAVLLVVLAHTPVPSRLIILNIAGAYGVQLFFVVSAFTLFLSMASRVTRDSQPVLFFFIRRIFRIVPAFYVAGIFYLIVNSTGLNPWAPDGMHAWQIIATALFVHGWFPLAMNAVVPGGWSIAVEMNFYLFVPLCFALATNIYRAFFLAVGLAILAVGLNRLFLPEILADYAHNPTILYWFPRLWFPTEACVFPIGFALFFLCDRTTGHMRSDRKSWMLIGIGAVIAIVLWRLRIAESMLVAAYGIGMFVYFIAVFSPRIFVNPIVQYIGKISFSVYLFQFWIIDLVREYLMPYWQNTNPYIMTVYFLICVVPPTCAVAALTHSFIEEPGQTLGKAVIKRIELMRAQQAA